MPPLSPLKSPYWAATFVAATLLAACADVAPEVASEDSGGAARPAREVDLAKQDGACGPWPSYAYRFLDDTRCVKRLPSNRDREATCPTVAAGGPVVQTFGGRSVTYLPAGAPVVVDDSALVGLVPSDLRVTLILVRRVEGVPHYRYLSNGRHHDVVQPWSTTKFLAAANAAARLRIASGYSVGLTARVDGWPLGDLVTVAHAYDERSFTSNGLSRYFHDIGGRARANELVRGWLGRPVAETFGGNYGAPAPGLGFHFVDAAGAVSLSRDAATPPPNQLSTYALAEALKRLVMHREDASTRLPGIQWADVRTLLYGADRSRLYDASTAQGMESDPAIYVQQALDQAAIDLRSQGRWRVFSKLGHGPSRGGEFAHVAYACLPALRPDGAPIPEVGKELFIATHLNAGGQLAEGDARLAEVYRTLVGRVLDGRLK